MTDAISAKQKLLDASVDQIRERGYEATTVDHLCHAAGVTKGAFFHHFTSKEDLAIAAADYWSTITAKYFSEAPYHKFTDPLKRVLGYIEFRKSILRGSLPEYTCLVGTMVQETYESHPAIRDACRRSIFSHADELAKDIALARKQYIPRAKWTSKSLALYTQAVIQGAFILAKASNDRATAADAIDHLYKYVQLLFKKETS